MSTPAVSVVMGVRDGAASLEETLASVLEPPGPEIEAIVVDDGSTDRTGDLLRRLAALDPRLRPVEQPPAGLTAALVRGCSLARGRYIARLDAGDRSLPGRISRLAARLDAEPELVLVSGGTRFVAPRREVLYEISQDDDAARGGLSATRPDDLRGPSIHGCVMFRRSAYERVGGYRDAFRVAQDLDLWLRLDEVGQVGAVPEVLYEARLGFESISALKRDLQLAGARLAFEARRRRAAGRSEADLLEKAEAATAKPVRNPGRRRAAAAYFFGSCLLAKDRTAAHRYFTQAIRESPSMIRAWVRWLRSLG